MNLDIPEGVKILVQDMQARINADSMSEVIRRAIILMANVVDLQDTGGHLLLQDKNGVQTRITSF
jgi:hypothetical protein